MKSRYIYCNRRGRLVAGLGFRPETFLVRSSTTELSMVYIHVAPSATSYTLPSLNVFDSEDNTTQDLYPWDWSIWDRYIKVSGWTSNWTRSLVFLVRSSTTELSSPNSLIYYFIQCYRVYLSITFVRARKEQQDGMLMYKHPQNVIIIHVQQYTHTQERKSCMVERKTGITFTHIQMTCTLSVICIYPYKHIYSFVHTFILYFILGLMYQYELKL